MDVEVRSSKIEGKGVFATKKFDKGETVLKWNPKKLSESDLENLPEEEKHYIYYENKVPFLMQPPERYVNHSCDANTKPEGLSDVAIREIQKGEEITSDYGSDPSVSFECKCGSNNCKGFVGTK